MAFIRPFKSEDTEDAKHIVRNLTLAPTLQPHTTPLNVVLFSTLCNTKKKVVCVVVTNSLQCRATLPPFLAASDTARRMAPYLWTLQYTHLFPTHCFVLDDGAGKAVGYVIGAPDVFALAAAYPRYVREVLQTDPGRGDVPAPPQLERLEPFTCPDTTGAQVVNETSLAQNAYSARFLVLEGVEGKAELVRAYRALLHIDVLEAYQGKGWGRQLIEAFVESLRKNAPAGTYDYGKGIHIGVSGENTKVVPFYEKLGFRVYPGGEREGNVWMTRDV